MSMELHFLGTGSAFPTSKRCTSCIALRQDKGIWIFDCGEGSQIQIQKSSLKPGRIKKIFITHMHGDHLYGLPGLLCTIGQNSSMSEQHIDIYGPVGIKNYLRSSLSLSYSYLPYTFAIHEIVLPSYEECFTSTTIITERIKDLSKIKLPLHPNEVPGEEIKKNELGHYDICNTDSLHVMAGLLKHTVPCIGYVIQEDDLPGKLDVSVLKLKGVPPGPIYGKIKNGESIQLDNGDIVRPEDCLGPHKRGRKLVILGDTYNSDSIISIANKPDVLVHEATNENADQAKSVEHGHSSAGMAGSFAEKIQAHQLILTHFSQRYRGLSEEEKEGTVSVAKLIEEAKEKFDFGDVIAAEDLLVYCIPLPK